MTAERRVVVSAETAVHAPVPAEGGPRSAPEGGPPDRDPLDTWENIPGQGPADVQALMRAQLRIALGTCAIVATVLVGLPLLALVPAVARARVHGVPLYWLVLVLGVQPVWIAVSFRQLRRAEQAERAAGLR
ncbi:hypothetical protein [Actinomadura sp. BRA 177]|uniref:hypothetical protein n=1 Tax=Actinomadura sp. BRA 177 TaxID=2745202 RepID=UPI0015954AF1|nr:hypothetical protein [Actinomadura sp. BRA 177]NVI91584.1 hypothetical protein [Actinomadura sp. BRA 177]